MNDDIGGFGEVEAIEIPNGFIERYKLVEANSPVILKKVDAALGACNIYRAKILLGFKEY